MKTSPGQIFCQLSNNSNGAYTEAIGTSPLQLTLGFKPRTATDLVFDPGEPGGMGAMRALYHKQAETALAHAAAAAKMIYDKKRRPLDIKVGDMVYLKLHRVYKLPGKPERKWSQQRIGPFEVLEKKGPLAFRLKLPPT